MILVEVKFHIAVGGRRGSSGMAYGSSSLHIFMSMNEVPQLTSFRRIFFSSSIFIL